jgi:carboxypeptidase family protein
MTPSTPGRRWLIVCGLSAALALLVLDSIGALAAAPLPQSRTRQPRERATGTATIEGVVTTASGQPIHRAQVVLSSQAAGGGQRFASTDALGRFEFRDLLAARYRLVASKPGYVTMPFGASSPHDVGAVIELRDRQAVQKLTVKLPAGGVISGRVVDEFGDPILDATVQAVRYEYSKGPGTLAAVGRPRLTDDRGQFRLFGLPPGRYYVSATLRRALARDDDLQDEPDRFAPAYYPGTSDVLQARPVSVSAAQEVIGIDFPLAPVQIARVSGIVTDSHGIAVVGATVRLARNRGLRDPVAGRTARTRKDGSFSIPDVPPGDFRLEAQGKGSDGDTEFGSTGVSINGSDLGGITVATNKGSVVRGLVRLDGTSPPSFSPAGVTVTARAPFEEPGSKTGGPTARIGPDWSFRLTTLYGARLIRLTGIRDPWSLKAVLLNGKDITDTGAFFESGGESAALEIVLTDRSASVTGTATDAQGAPLKDYIALVFADDSSLWGPYSRFVQYARGDDVRGFRMTGLPPGRYRARVFEFLPHNEWNDLDFLEQSRQGASPFTVTDSGSVKLALKLAPAP